MLSDNKTNVDTPSYLAKTLGIQLDLRIKRDDLYPQFGGGSKARKSVYIVNHAIKSGYDTIVTNGGPQSNHARATAIFAAQMGLQCHLIIVFESDTKVEIKGNLLLMKLSGASIEYCKKDELAFRMDESIKRLKQKGRNPLYLWGGGHCLQGTLAYVEAAKEAQDQCGSWIPDFIFLASGTGSTQAGLAIGYAEYETKVVGISVARDYIRGTQAIFDSIDEYYSEINQINQNIKVIFLDEWTDGGYERSSKELIDLILHAAKTGYFFDPTYTGKALRGMVSMCKNGDIPPGSKVLFWHTGGLINLLSSEPMINLFE